MVRTGDPLRIAHLAAECVPFAKTGGLADVVGSLPKALARRGHVSDVWMPFHLDAARWYRRRLTWPEQGLPPFRVLMPGREYEVGVLRGHLPGTDVSVWFVAHDPLFHRPGGLYAPNAAGKDDGLWRFGLFVRAAVEAMKRLGQRPQILHAHDWHPALATMLGAWSSWREPWFDDVASVFTIHNIAYQGVYGAGEFPALGLPVEAWTGGKLASSGALNLMKGALEAADVITTVSPTYAREIQTPAGGAGLHGVVRGRAERLVGILNGIDREVWDPAHDTYLPSHYSARDFRGKAECRAELCRTAHFDPGEPDLVLGAIGRLTDQKGFDLLLEAAPELLRRGVRIVMLGSGDAALEGAFRVLQAHAPHRVKAFIGYDEAMAHLIVAGADAILMPSRFEPCGLTQMYGLAYGTVPVVRRTGGLADSVVPFDGENFDRATGFHFLEAAPHALAAEVLHAQHMFFHKEPWWRIARNGMAVDNSWEHAAGLYEAVYRRARELRGLGW